MIRITAGKYRGRRIFTAGMKARPAVSIVREAVFNVLRSYISIEGKSVCDLFCGTSSLSFEALSRGASHACAVDVYLPNLKLVKRTAISLGVDSQMNILCCDIRKLPWADRRYDLVFIDPPYDKPELASQTLQILQDLEWCGAGSIVVLRIRKGEVVSVPEYYGLLNTRQYGCSQLMFLEANNGMCAK